MQSAECKMQNEGPGNREQGVETGNREPRRRGGHWPPAGRRDRPARTPAVGAALIRQDEPPGLRSKQSPPGRSGPGANQQKPPSNPVARAMSPHTQLRCSDPAAASGCGWICLRQIAFVPNACGQIARATDGCVLLPRLRHRNPVGFACGKLRSFRTPGRAPLGGSASPTRTGERGQAVCIEK